MPILKMKLYQDWRNKYDEFYDMIENAAITFSMKDKNTGIYKVANKVANLELKKPSSENSKKEYLITYNFSKDDTDTSGIYLGEFKLVFFNEEMQISNELITPIREDLEIHILQSFVKSDL